VLGRLQPTLSRPTHLQRSLNSKLFKRSQDFFQTLFENFLLFALGHTLFHRAQALKYPSLAQHILEDNANWAEYCRVRKEAMEILQHEAMRTDGAFMRDILKNEFEHTIGEIRGNARDQAQVDRILTLFRDMSPNATN